MNRKIQDAAPFDTPPAAEAPAKDWVELFFARANPHAEFDAASAMAQSASQTLAVSTTLAIAGRRIDLAGLENWIGRLTASSLDLDPSDGRRMRPILIGLLHQLDALELAMAAGSGTA